MGVIRDAIEHAPLFQVLEDVIRNPIGSLTRKPGETVNILAAFIQGSDHRELVLLSQLKILRAATGRDMDNPGTLFLAHLTPRDDSMGSRGTGLLRYW